MSAVTYTLLSDGSSDRALMPLLDWLLRQHMPSIAIQGSWADLRRLPRPPRSLVNRIQTSVDLFPCDLLFVHRDAPRLYGQCPATWLSSQARRPSPGRGSAPVPAPSSSLAPRPPASPSAPRSLPSLRSLRCCGSTVSSPSPLARAPEAGARV